MRNEKNVNYDNLIYYFKGTTSPINFIKFEGSMHIDDRLKNGEKTLEQVQEDQKHFEKDLNEIKAGNPKHKSKKQLYAIENIKNLYDARQKFIDLINDYTKIRSEAIYNSKQNETKGRGLKILTPKQMVQRFPIALAEVQAGNNSQNLLNEIRQIV